MAKTLRKYISKNVVVVDAKNISLKKFSQNKWETYVKFDFFDDLDVEHKRKLQEILETIDLSLFDCDFNVQTSAIIDHCEMLKNFVYVLDHESNNIQMKFVILNILPKVRFFDEYIIDQYLEHKNLRKSDGKITNIFDFFNAPQTGISYASPKEFIRIHKINKFFSNRQSIRLYNELPEKCFLEIPDDNENSQNNDYLKQMHDYMYFYDEHNKELHDWSFQNRTEIIKIALKGFENVSVCELTAFFALNDFDNKLNECLNKSSKEILYTDDLPRLSNFVEAFKLDYSCFDGNVFSSVFEQNFQVILSDTSKNEYSKIIDYKGIIGQYHFYMFLFILMNCDADKFSQFCNFIIKNEYYKEHKVDAFVRDNLSMLREWAKEDSEIGLIPFNLLANMF